MWVLKCRAQELREVPEGRFDCNTWASSGEDVRVGDAPLPLPKRVPQILERKRGSFDIILE